MKKATFMTISAIMAMGVAACAKPSEDTLVVRNTTQPIIMTAQPSEPDPTDIPSNTDPETYTPDTTNALDGNSDTQKPKATENAKKTETSKSAVTEKPEARETPKVSSAPKSTEKTDTEPPAPGTTNTLEACIQGTIEWMTNGNGIKQVKTTANLKQFFETAEAKKVIGSYEVYEFENGSFFGYVKYNQKQPGVDEHGYIFGEGCTFLDEQMAKMAEKLNGVTQTTHYDSNWSAFFFGKNKEDSFRLESYFTSCSVGEYYSDYIL